jgi:methanethiol S-methyltransferase
MSVFPPSSPAVRAFAWLGGTMFVLSLTWTLFSILVRLGPAEGAQNTASAVAIDVLLFTGFALHHSLLARPGVKRWLEPVLSPQLERTVYVWIASLLLFVTISCWRSLPGRAYQHVGLWAVPHWIAIAAGLWITARATGLIDPLQLAGIRQARGDQRNVPFIAAGPYHLVRHPIYLGWLLIVFGGPDMTWTRLLFAVVSSAYLAIAIPFEERSLVESLGERYRQYQKNVRWRLIPGIW